MKYWKVGEPEPHKVMSPHVFFRSISGDPMSWKVIRAEPSEGDQTSGIEYFATSFTSEDSVLNIRNAVQPCLDVCFKSIYH
jgi:hypothetical protein